MQKLSLPCERVTWARFYELARRLAHQVRDSGYRPDTIVAIGRGGYMPARILSDYLEIMDLTSFKIEHYRGATRQTAAQVRYPLTGDLSGRKVLLVDDVSDSGDTFAAAIAHLQEHGPPDEIRTAALDHKTVSRFEPDYYARRIVKWRWIVYPWALIEDLTTFVRGMHPRPDGADELAARIESGYGMRVPLRILQDVLAIVGSDH